MESKTERSPHSENAALWAIVEGVEAETGDRFFQSLVKHLASALQVQYAFVSEFTEDRRRFRSLAAWGRGHLLENFEVPLAGSPCEAVLNGEISHHPARLRQLFPRDEGLAEWRAESYCGVPLLDSTGAVMGHLAIMRIFAARTCAELERLRAEAMLRESEERLARILASAMDPILTFDAERRIQLFNDAAEKVFRCSRSQAIGASIDRFLTDGLRKALDESIAHASTGGLSRPYPWAPAGLFARRADGSEFPIEATISRVEVAGRSLCTLILRDIDERRRAEEELRRLHRDNVYLQEEIRSVHNFEEIVGQSGRLSAALNQVRLVAGTDSSVLITGETGTGKELIARAVHSSSARKDRPLIKVNCASLPTGLIESELFGHEKGAFTGAVERRIGRFELAHGGTIFLDEIGEVPLEVQVKLLRVLQEREFERVGGSHTIKVDVRVIAATNRDLLEAVAEGKFRQDLYYRLSVFPIHLPPLRERREDIPLLAHYFISRYAAKIGRRFARVGAGALHRLVAYPWPGNIRELENVIERATILSTGDELDIQPEMLPETPLPGDFAPLRAGSVPAPDATALLDVERSHILAVLKKTGWRVDGPNGAARLLNLNPSTLRSRMKKLGIRRSAHELS